MEKVKIYVLVDPITLKVRYIGRTKCDLKKRLREHISKSKKDYSNTHKSNWVKSLLKINSKPYIRLLCVVDGWKESHIIERKLINKYKDRLVNLEDRGEGGLNKNISIDSKNKISNSLKSYYEINRNNLSYCKKIYVYNYNGTFHSEYPSIKEAVRVLGFNYTKIHKFFNTQRKKPNKKGLQFSYEKVESMRNWEQQLKINRRLVW